MFDGDAGAGHRRRPTSGGRRTGSAQAYGQSIQYSLDALVSFVRDLRRRRHLVLVVLGDHQPATIVSGQGAGHDVPVTVIAHDPAVLRRVSGWGWQDGHAPGRTDAPVWRMDAFRDRFLRRSAAERPHDAAHCEHRAGARC